MIVSFIVTAYNASATIKDCISSILNISGFEYEIIIVDDFSSDNTHQILEEIASSYRNIKIIKNNKNFGPGYSRNIALDNAIGKYISIIDADDQIISYEYEKLILLINKNNIPIAASNMLICYEKYSKLVGWIRLTNQKLFFKKEVTLEDLCINELGLLKPIILRKIIYDNKIKYYESYAGEDFAFLFECILLANKNLYLSRNVGYKYRISENSLSTSYNRPFQENLILFELIRKYSNKRVSELLLDHFYNRISYKKIKSIFNIKLSIKFILLNINILFRLSYNILLRLYRIVWCKIHKIKIIR